MTERKTISAPHGHGRDAIQYSAAQPTAISVAVGVNDAGEHQFASVDAPRGSHVLLCQRRMCSDHYAEFTAGQVIHSAVVPHQFDAIRDAAAKFEVWS